MAGGLDAGATQRLDRLGLPPLTAEHGLALFDAALAADTRSLVTAALDLAALQAQARAGALPPLLRGLVRPPAAAPRAAAAGSLAQTARRRCRRRAADRPRSTLVRAQVAAVLGHAARRRSTPTAPSRTSASTR